MATLKTQPTDDKVQDFLDTLTDEQKRADCLALIELMREEIGEPPRMWGKSIVGFGSYHYVYDSGREGDWFLAGFSPRKQNLSVYIMAGFDGYEELLGKLGKHKTGKSCLYLKKLSDADEQVLRKLLRESVDYLREKYGR